MRRSLRISDQAKFSIVKRRKLPNELAKRVCAEHLIALNLIKWLLERSALNYAKYYLENMPQKGRIHN